MPNDYSHDDLTGKLATQGWQRSSGDTNESGTLEDMARAAHVARRRRGTILIPGSRKHSDARVAQMIGERFHHF